MMNWRVIICLVIVTLIILPGSVAAADDFSVSSDNMIDVPDREQSVPFGDSKDVVTHVSKLEQDQNLSVTTIGPEQGYDVQLLTPIGRTADAKAVNGGGEATLEFDTVDILRFNDPGLYTVGIVSEGSFKEVHPVIIKEYDVTVSPETTTVTKGTEVTATVTVPGGIDDAYQVEGILANTEDGNERKRVDATEGNSEDTYTVSIPTTGLDEGSYKLSAAVINEGAAAKGNDNILGISGLTSITINEDSDDSESDDSESDDSESDDSESDDSDDSDSDNGGSSDSEAAGSGGGGAGGSGGPNILNAPGARTVDEVREISSLFTADSETEVQTSEGTAMVSEATTVDTVEFNSVESTSVSVTEYNSLSEKFEENIIDSAKADGVDVSQEDTVVSFSEINADIPVTEDASATITFTVNRDNVANADSISVVKEVTTENGNEVWEQKPTTVVNADGDTVTVETEVDSLSMFAIVEQSNSSADSADSQSSDDKTSDDTVSENSSDSTSESETPLPLTIPVVALILVTVYFRRQN
jgi:hypothetical protein